MNILIEINRYTSKNVNDLIALKKLYEKENLHIADMAKIIAQNAAFEMFTSN